MERTIEVYIDDSGCLLIPEAFRDELGILPGMTATVEEAEEGGVRLCMRRGRSTLVDKEGVWVIRTEPNDDVADIIRQGREQRLSDLAQRTIR